jgi:hypothetical protein
MSPLDQAVVKRKLSHLNELLTLLRAESHTSLTAYLIDPSRVHAALAIALRDLSELADALAARVRI